MDDRRILIEKALDGSLSAEDRKVYDAFLANDPTFAAEVKSRNELALFMSSNSSDSFSPFFVDKLMKKVSSGDGQFRTDSLLESLMWTFKRVAFASAFVVVALLSFNTLTSEDSSQSLVEMAFDIPAVTIDAAQDDFGLILP